MISGVFIDSDIILITHQSNGIGKYKWDSIN